MKQKTTKNCLIFPLVILLILLSVVGSLQAQDEAKTHYQNGYLFFSQQKFEQAKEEYQKALELNPNFWEARYWLGKTLEQLGDLPRALNEWVAILVSSPSNKEAFQKWITYAPRIWGKRDVDLVSFSSEENLPEPEKLWKEILPRAILLSESENLDNLLIAIQVLDLATQKVSNLFSPYLRSTVNRAVQNILNNPQPEDIVTYQLLSYLKKGELITQEQTKKIFALLFAQQAGIPEEQVATTETLELEISTEGVTAVEGDKNKTQSSFFINQP
ncbi:MAG: tetratricopeptide repeat protein [Candidatus Atribacteria bacterium]|nr:tetratricopeptide repeat protein [Candidatus Atribacteria bacterium]MCD6349751.1 tetratricopeptide repeat protein [Candidatus Atribacteria bacterium]